MDLSLWLAFVAASTIICMVPGPSVMLVLTYAVSQGRRVAVSTTLGVALGDLIAMTASLTGLGALVLASATVFTMLKWLGAAYLVWLGLRMIFGAQNTSVDIGDVTSVDAPRTAFWTTTAVTALNPKSIVFFIAFVPQFLDPTAPLVSQSAILIATYVCLGAINALAYALLADRLRGAIRRPSVIAWLTRAGGGALVAMGIATASLRRATA